MHKFHRKCNMIRVGGAPERNIIGSGVQGEPPPGFYILKGGVMFGPKIYRALVSNSAQFYFSSFQIQGALQGAQVELYAFN